MSSCFYSLDTPNRPIRNTSIDIIGRATSCTLSDIPFPTTFEEYKNSNLMRHKGNVLQYKKNQNPLSQKQIYSRKIQKLWTNHNKSWASQTDQYTFPNTSSLLRVGSVLKPSATPCNPFVNTSSSVLNIPPYNYDTPPVNTNNIPPIVTPIENENVQPVTQPKQESQCVYVDGGTLVCTKVVDPISGNVILTTHTLQCYPTTDSNVPGMGVLCWKEGEPTSYN